MADPTAKREDEPDQERRPPDHHGDDHRHPQGWRVDPEPGGRGTPPTGKSPLSSLSGRRYALFILLLLGINIWVVSLLPEPKTQTVVRIPYSPIFLQQVESGNVKSISSKGETVEGALRRELRYPAKSKTAKPTTAFKTEVPTFANEQELSRLLESHGVVINAEPPTQERSALATLLLSFGPTLLLVGLFVLLFRRMAGGSGLGGFSRSRARRIEPSAQRIDFADVAGIDEAKAELVQIVDFLKDPDKYRRLGGRIPRGVLLTGPPGTGKTLLARALAGEAEVPFFSISASEFVELFVGVGASRVRDLFAEAKKAAPAIIFIDELDAIGRVRGPGVGASGGHDEREQTLNQILTEMDGFDTSIGVIVLSATNRPEVLDPALLRPGRFDRRVTLQPPDTAGRRKILAVHTRSVPLADDVDLGRLAARMPGMVGADLANIVNEAALLAASRDRTAVTTVDFDDALEKLILGTERRILLSDEERRRSAYHEAGHAIVAMLTPEADPVRKVSIVPRGIALGVTLSAPEADRFSYDRAYLMAKLEVGLGGRVAEELVFDEVTTGAQSDIKEVTRLARQMVGVWGMSDRIGPLAVIPEDGAFIPNSGEFSPDTARRVDEEIKRLVDEALVRVRRLLADHRDKLDALADALLERETLDAAEAHAAVDAAPVRGQRADRAAEDETTPPAAPEPLPAGS